MSDTDIAASSAARNWEMFCHLSALFGYMFPLGWVVGPLLVWQFKKEEFPSIVEHGRAAVNFQLSMMIYAAVAGALCFFLIGIPLLIATGLTSIICSILAGVKASNGGVYRYPLTIRFIK